jgi:hypothetical protein
VPPVALAPRLEPVEQNLLFRGSQISTGGSRLKNMYGMLPEATASCMRSHIGRPWGVRTLRVLVV